MARISPAESVLETSNVHGDPDRKPPPLTLAIIIVGTKGDCLPFIALAHRLIREFGHTVRIASHGDLRETVEAHGLRFFPLAGTTRQMAVWAPSFSLKPLKLLALSLDVKETMLKLTTLRRIMLGTYAACTQPDPADEKQTPFHADAIIANPTPAGHFHVHAAQALGVPLHLANPFPVVATRAHPHVHSGWKHTGRASAANYMSASMVNDLLFYATLPCANELRCNLRLRTLRLGGFGGSLVKDQRVPVSHMWSPSFSPRPADWPEHVGITGFCFWEDDVHFGGGASAEPGPEHDSLRAWLEAGPPPVLINWGSMVFDGAKAAALCVEAARLAAGDGDQGGGGSAATVRVLLQSGASTFDTTALEPLPTTVFVTGPVSHRWLLQRVCAVVCHAGAGTVGAALRAGLPMLACPFFGDQTFWAHRIASQGLGLQIPFHRLTASNLADALSGLCGGKFTPAAVAVAASIRGEDGLGALLSDFHRRLPLERMLCHAHLLLGEAKVAIHACGGIQLSGEALEAAVHARLLDSTAKVVPHRSVTWDLGSAVRTPALGVWSCLMAGPWELGAALVGLLALPLKGMCAQGPYGFVVGVLVGLLLLLLRPLYALIIMLDRFGTGFLNSCWAEVPRDHVVDPEAALTALARLPLGEPLALRRQKMLSPTREAATAEVTAAGGSAAAGEASKREVLGRAYARAAALRRAFEWCGGRAEAGVTGPETARHTTPRVVLGEEALGRLTELPAELAKLCELPSERVAALAAELTYRLRRHRADGAPGKTRHLSYSQFVVCVAEVDRGAPRPQAWQ